MILQPGRSDQRGCSQLWFLSGRPDLGWEPCHSCERAAESAVAPVVAPVSEPHGKAATCGRRFPCNQFGSQGKCCRQPFPPAAPRLPLLTPCSLPAEPGTNGVRGAGCWLHHALEIQALGCTDCGSHVPGTQQLARQHYPWCSVGYSPQEIKKFAESKYGVTFPLFSKVDVNGQWALGGGGPSQPACLGHCYG